MIYIYQGSKICSRKREAEKGGKLKQSCRCLTTVKRHNNNAGRKSLKLS